MSRKKIVRPATSKAMQGNQNAVKPDEEKMGERVVLTLSLHGRRKERIRSAIEWYEGYVPDDDEVEKKAREIAYLAWDEYAARVERDRERAIIL